jgi:predicted HTH domain antitoxin
MELSIIERFPLFESYEKKERFFTVLGLLFTRQVTLAKAAELLGMSREELSGILKLMGLEYSYLTKDEVKREKEASEALMR